MIQLHFPPKLRSVSSLLASILVLASPVSSSASLCCFLPRLLSAVSCLGFSLLLSSSFASCGRLLTLPSPTYFILLRVLRSAVCLSFFKACADIQYIRFHWIRCKIKSSLIMETAKKGEVTVGFGKSKNRWGDRLDFLFKKVWVPMFWNRGPVKVPLPLSDEKQEGGESIL